MGLRLRADGYTDLGKQVRVDIYDDNYASATIDIITTDQIYEITFHPGEEGLKFQILGTKCSVFIIVDSADVESFIDDLNTAYETQMKIAIYTENDVPATLDLLWVGFVLTDLTKIEDLPLQANPVFTLTATDGLKRMKKTAYKDTSGPYTGVDSLAEHLLKCLGHLGLNSFIELLSASDVVLTTGLNWYATGQATGDPAEMIKFDHRALYQYDKQGVIKYTTVYDVIQMICRVFHCRFYQWYGRFKISQHNEYQTGSLPSQSYKSDFTKVGGYLTQVVQHAHNATFDGKRSGGEFSFFPPLNIVQINYVHFGYINLAQGYVWDETTQPTIPEAPTTYTVSADTVFTFCADLHYTIQGAGDRPVWMYFGFKFNVGSDYLKREITTQTGEVSWYQEQITATATDRYEYPVMVDANNVGQFDAGYVPICFTTMAFPNEGDFGFSIEYLETWGLSSQILSGITVTWTITNVRLNPIPSEGDVSQWFNTRTVTGYNSTTGNSEKITLNNQIGQEFGFGKILVENASGVDIVGENWGVGAEASGISLEERLAIEYIRSQAGPVKKMTTIIDRGDDSYVDLLQMEDVLIHDGGDVWVFHSGKWIGGKEVLDATWYLASDGGLTSGNTTDDAVIEFIDPDGNEIVTVYPTGIGGGVPPAVPDNSGNPSTPGVTNVIDVLFPRTTDDIDEGDTVTQIPIETRTVAGEYKVGQTITLVSPWSGAQQTFTVTTESQVSDTVINVSSVTADFDFPTGSWIVKSQETQEATGGGSTSMYREEFPAHASATITVTENSGNLPTNAAAIRVYFDNGQIISKNYWSHSGSVITLTYTPLGQQSIWVEFTI